MKPSFVKLLACPACSSGLDLRSTAREDGEVMEGALACHGCKVDYPIVRGVPRFVKAGAYASSFGKQWNWFRTVQLDSLSGSGESERTFDATTGWNESDLTGRLLLDAGVGAGRFAEIAARRGAEVVGVDLTDAVDAAFENIGRQPHVHLAQADIFALPFRSGSFDLAYSIGVLHHTPDPHAAFERVAAMLRPGGALAVYMYAAYGPSHRVSDLLRKVTTRLPLKLMLGLSTAAVPLYYVNRLPGIGRLLRLFVPISMHPDWRWRWLDTFDWYTPEYQFKYLYPEIHRWFRNAGFGDLVVFEDPIRMRGVKGGRGTMSSVPPRTTTRGPGASALRVACIGGGTGLPVVLNGLKQGLFPQEWRFTPARGRDRLTAIVTVADDGGSSGRLRRAYRVLAPGDIRNCLLALADGDGALAPLFRFRFTGQADVGGHSLGNLILTALGEVEGDFARGIERAGQILGIRGRVLPSTTSDVTLVAELEDGTSVAGESHVASPGSRIRRLKLDPAEVPAHPAALEALRAADVVVIGPGSLYTSLLPNLLVSGVAEAIRDSGARVVFVMNLMTEPGETDGQNASQHLEIVRRHVPALPIHDVLVSSTTIDGGSARQYASTGAEPVEVDVAGLAEFGCRVIERDLLAGGAKVRHDPGKLSATLLALASEQDERPASEAAASAPAASETTALSA